MVRIIKTALKWIARTLLFLVGFIVLYLVTAFVASRITVNGNAGGGHDVAIYIKTNGVHTDIVVPVKNDIADWSTEVKYSNTTGNDTGLHYMAVGWGDKGFYLQTPTWADLKFSVAFNAVCGLSTTAMHVTFYGPLAEHESCHQIWISRAEYTKLVHYISGSFQKGADGHFQYIKTNANYGSNDAFYEANGSYCLFFTCNTWANSALKSCNQRACLWTVFKTGIFQKYEKGQ